MYWQAVFSVVENTSSKPLCITNKNISANGYPTTTSEK